MLFFQMALLGGYAYAHWVNGQRGRKQTVIHLALLALSFLSLPILPNAGWKPQGIEDPLLRILGLLVRDRMAARCHTGSSRSRTPVPCWACSRIRF
jgi:hypothetical protein